MKRRNLLPRGVERRLKSGTLTHRDISFLPIRLFDVPIGMNSGEAFIENASGRVLLGTVSAITLKGVPYRVRPA